MPGEGVRSSVSFLVESLNSEKRDIGVLNYRILRISINDIYFGVHVTVLLHLYSS